MSVSETDPRPEAPRGRHEDRAPNGRVVDAWTDGHDAAGEIARDLAAAISGEVRFGAGDRALYSTDSSNYRQVPIGVVVPRSAEDVVRALEVCRRHDAPVTMRGGGTSLAGQTCNTAVVFDFSKYLRRVLDIDPGARRARVEPGCVLDVLRHEAEAHGLTFGPDPATHDHNTLGGMIGNNSCGVHSVQTGRTADNVEALDVVTYDGVRFTAGKTSDEAFRAIQERGGRLAEIYREMDAFRRRWGPRIRAAYPDIPRRVSGYADLDKLNPEHGFDVAKALVGTEGTLVTVLSADLRLVEHEPERVLLIIGVDDIVEAAELVPMVLEHGPVGCEGIDDFLVDSMKRKHLNVDDLKLLPEGSNWLVVEFAGRTGEEAAGKAEGLRKALGNRGHHEARLVRRQARQQRIWRIREAGLPGSAYVPDRPETWEGWEDTAVPRERLADYLRGFKKLLDKYGYVSPLYGHFGDGLVHARISYDLKSEEGIVAWRKFLDEAADLVISLGGSLSGEHGDGQARGELLERMYGPEIIEAFREFKRIFDPGNRMNPGKVVDPYPISSNLRLGPSYRPPELHTHFAFQEDGGFAGAAERCVGVGKCRRPSSDGQVMCPSYMVTLEEKHSTRGRARMLFEMVHGGAIDDGWKSDEVEDALKLCLACKGCKSDCPVNVDMATYKAEFRSHYYRNRLRPRSAYSMGLIYWWARAASKTPNLVNRALGAPGIGRLLKKIGGIAPEREMPRFARRTFGDWFDTRVRPPAEGREPVVLWPDTFNNFFRPETAVAAVEVLEAAGYAVSIPRRPLCCGRPLYDEGMLDTAKRLWRQTLSVLDPVIEAGTPMVGLEPACVAAFKDELVNLFPDDAKARRLSEQTHLFADFMADRLDRLDLEPAGERRALVQVHCNHHAIIGGEGEQRLLAAMGIDAEFAPSGCCGMAGSFGFAEKTYEVGLAAGERVILPMVRGQDEATAILADGFSCREQIEQGTGRRTRHVAEALRDLVKTGHGTDRPGHR